jgi:hypothetical protein
LKLGLYDQIDNTEALNKFGMSLDDLNNWRVPFQYSTDGLTPIKTFQKLKVMEASAKKKQHEQQIQFETEQLSLLSEAFSPLTPQLKVKKDSDRKPFGTCDCVFCQFEANTKK